MSELEIPPEVQAEIDSRRSVEKWHDKGQLVHEMKVNLTQPGNTLGTTDEMESLEIRLEYQIPEAKNGEDCFIVLRTETGWSIDSLDDLREPVAALLACARRLAGAKVEESDERTIELEPEP